MILKMPSWILPWQDQEAGHGRYPNQLFKDDISVFLFIPLKLSLKTLMG
jgi:hypothetical protein